MNERTRLLVQCSPDAPPQAHALAAFGWALAASEDAAAAAEPQALGLWWCADDARLAQLLGDGQAFERPMVVMSAALADADQQALLSRGAVHWLPLDLEPAALAAQLCWAEAMAVHAAARERAWQARLDERLDERKWTERAKGLLMQARGIDEGAAFALLRTTAMQTQVKLPQVARAVVHTSELAEALERAGAQRFLAQRLVKLQALRQWPRLTPPERREVQALLDASVQRVRGNIARLSDLLQRELGDDVAAVSAAWEQLDAAMAARQPDLARCNEAAQRLVDSSEALVARLSERAGQRPVALLAQVTRLRLLSQRLAKEGLLAQVVPGHDVSGLAAGLDEFIRAYEQVRATPLAGPALQPAFAEVDEAWLLLLRGLRVEQGDAVQRMHQGSERLLQALEGLTQALQGSLQLILG